MNNFVSENINFDLVFKKLEMVKCPKVLSSEIKEKPKMNEVELLKESYYNEQDLINSLSLCDSAELFMMFQSEEIEKGREIYERMLLDSIQKPILKRTIV